MACLLFITCGKQRRPHINFYFWRQDFILTSGELAYLEKSHTPRVYAKFFDVVWDETVNDAVPLAKIHFDTHPPAHLELIPCVFITNRVMEKTPARDIPLLAQRIITLLETLRSAVGISAARELQVDCDWSVGTKRNYFALLTELKTLDPHALLSVTIRLHQVKYPETTGVPPADKAVLMFYNTGNLEDVNTHNSIIDLERARDYLDGLPAYPLHTNIALPAFSWAVLLRFDKVTKLIHNVSPQMLEKAPQLEHITDNLYKVKKSFYFSGYYLYKDDILRYEDVEISVLQQAADMLAPKIRNRDLDIIFFHLNNHLTEEYSYEELEDIGSRFYYSGACVFRSTITCLRLGRLPYVLQPAGSHAAFKR